VGRGDLSRALLIVAVAAAAAASAAAAAVGVHWRVLAAGRTTPADVQMPLGYVAVTRREERRFSARLSASHRAALRRLDLARTGVVAVFLDGARCPSDVAVSSIARTSTTVTVRLRYTRPPIGFATCVQMSTPYVLIGVTRASLGRPAPTRVKVVAIARS
jgi:hypothetical protein